NSWSTGLKTRKTLTLVCKTLLGPASEVLYEDIVLRRMGQIVALARTLDPCSLASRTHRSLSGDPARLVKWLRLDSCVVWTPCADVIQEAFCLILTRCTSLRALSFHPHPEFPLGNPKATNAALDPVLDAFNPKWFLPTYPDVGPANAAIRHHLASRLQTLDLSLSLDGPHLVSLHTLLSSAPHIVSLHLETPSTSSHVPAALDLPDATLGALEPITLPALETLHLRATHPLLLHFVVDTLILPRLRVLAAHQCPASPHALLAAH
ncbi:uncharacterized protein BXZ73DRAFT_1509, partial [Epithele typhae]|uniref:uncharacterized protein n=1 Tax=Epithele typhae TaxID=378194 RepID=UPI002007B12E